MKCIVVDDEMPARDEIIYLLNDIGGLDIIGEASDGESALKLIKSRKPDVVFLDINMTGMDGFDLVNEILKFEHIPLIVFVTAYDQYAIKAFEVNAIDYILKPINKERLKKTVRKLKLLFSNENINFDIEKRLNKLISKLNQPNEKIDRICVYENGKYIPLNPKEILYLTTVGRNTIIKTKNGQFTTNYTLSEMEEKLSKYNFFRSHRSFLVNLDEVKEIHNWFNGTFQIVLNGAENVKISVSRNKAGEFKEIMNI
ncbi:two component transcriptional regulator, LytTR family [Caminicella sporogenes DSM 14501]|uniref:Stage 0 sporulation protein A homolog n=1 Tax=Caminicella sporogenes DSM 14501 TaxID=1121266 RepID=A0A1M6MGA5_9FIRM|nr:LytTR family DNA-binding domain-containing protein [Caminicella sporogenes]RKD27561.1 DNA-binding response regulator [Caminicella sporogenes]WIF94855.1 LytTR family DNA-binding domain-containing protein [Caminicella sporogenes]SHJ82501.1 two component transcriptional regulator, LytTR family [Caminicella sporogenes DSM 14501]